MAQFDLDRLIDAAIPFAQQMLLKHGEFYPFGFSLDTTGQISADSPISTTSMPEPQLLIENLKYFYRQAFLENKIVAACICLGVTLREEKGDAIQIHLEHANGKSIHVYLPYTARGGQIEYGELASSLKDRELTQ